MKQVTAAFVDSFTESKSPHAAGSWLPVSNHREGNQVTIIFAKQQEQGSCAIASIGLSS
jgi:hypothetical protein